MKRIVGATFLAVVFIRLIWSAALVLLAHPPRWLAHGRHGEQAYGMLLAIASIGIHAIPVLAAAAVLLGGVWLWQRWAVGRRTA